jgi:hypothetical protein
MNDFDLRSSCIQHIVRIITVAVTSVTALASCATQHYIHTKTGTLEGDLIVQWRKPDEFLFIPSVDHPLKFTRSRNGDVIQPDRMWTDGGSIPRPFWVFKNYSPWGYGPAFIIHDWLFHMQDCRLPGYDKYDLNTAATVMSEVMKTLIEDHEFNYGDKTSMYMMYKAVQTEPARKAWEDHDCKPVPETVERSLPDEVFHFSFGPPR